MQHQTPQTRAQGLTQLVQQTIIPMMPLLQKAGIRFDVEKYLEKMADYLDLPDLAEIVTIEEIPQGDPSGGGDGGGDAPGMPAQTQRRLRTHQPAGRHYGGAKQQPPAVIDGRVTTTEHEWASIMKQKTKEPSFQKGDKVLVAYRGTTIGTVTGGPMQEQKWMEPAYPVDFGKGPVKVFETLMLLIPEPRVEETVEPPCKENKSTAGTTSTAELSAAGSK